MGKEDVDRGAGGRALNHGIFSPEDYSEELDWLKIIIIVLIITESKEGESEEM